MQPRMELAWLEEHALILEVSKPDLLKPCQSMRGGEQHPESVTAHLQVAQGIIPRRVGTVAEGDRPLPQRRPLLDAAHRNELQADARGSPAERRDEGQEHAHEGRARLEADDDGPEPPFGDALGLVDGGIDARQDAPGSLREGLPGGGELDATPLGREELDAHLLLEILHLPAQRRL